MSTLDSVRESYQTFDDQRFAPLVKGVVLFALLAALPFIIEIDVAGMELAATLSLKVLILTVIYAYTAQSWNIMSGYTGQFSFGHAAFFGIGAYATQKLLVDFAINPWIGMLVAGIIAGLYGLLIGALTFRFNLKGHYFALATLAFAELLRFVVTNMSELRGANGYFKPFPRDYGAEYGLAAFQFQSDLPYYYVIVGFLLVVTVISWAIKNSWVGLYFFAIREDERAAASVGVPSFRYKLIGVAVSAFFTALGGAYWSMYFNTIRPDTVFALFKNVEILLPAVVGGPGTLIGPIVGSFIVTPVSEIARTTFTDINGLDRIIYGAFLVAIVIYSPRGVVSWPSRARALWNRVRGDTEVSEQ
ncbi:branched-chain amino acid ABC transporter permease [Haloferax sp. MBLA0076]|uniref:Branched-chain amino acid ABC transporter permease n=1 Tax=Haloferax litoreum TaxID=2666140 RepID=A0A6A8GKX1_9EURY|nr:MULTISPECIES: branched-chain amino acid ABC transporter permease [Haloferax]KAB1190031.1 branched-chain amino acid ABC transporter permease [Haloferax sp. CBA1148]MRX23805.1 branched-chain amino acid ABC transporter permease [Haloferax litoreum]